jgi:anti-anti-sigma factor
MKLFPTYDGKIVILAPKERLDHVNADSFQFALRPFLRRCHMEGFTILLDFSDVPYISSVGLRVLMLAKKQAKNQNGTIAIAGLQPRVREIFEISRFHTTFRLFYSRTNALSALSLEFQPEFEKVAA